MRKQPHKPTGDARRAPSVSYTTLNERGEVVLVVRISNPRHSGKSRVTREELAAFRRRQAAGAE